MKNQSEDAKKKGTTGMIGKETLEGIVAELENTVFNDRDLETPDDKKKLALRIRKAYDNMMVATNCVVYKGRPFFLRDNETGLPI